MLKRWPFSDETPGERKKSRVEWRRKKAKGGLQAALELGQNECCGVFSLLLGALP